MHLSGGCTENNRCCVCPQYLVKRKGLDFSACGLVDARAAKRQRLPPSPPAAEQVAPDQAAKSACPVSVAMMDEYEAFNRSFLCAVHAHSDSGELDLGAALRPVAFILHALACCMHSWSILALDRESTRFPAFEGHGLAGACIPSLSIYGTLSQRSGMTLPLVVQMT